MAYKLAVLDILKDFFLHVCAIPTHRVYRLYDNSITSLLVKMLGTHGHTYAQTNHIHT